MKTQLITLALGLAAFAGPARAQMSTSLQADSLPNTVTVQNNRTVPVTIYMDYGEFDRRLGTVPALQTATLALPAWAVRGRDRISLFVHPEGAGQDLASRVFALQPPARIGILVPARGEMSRAPTDTMTAVIPPEELADATLTVDNPRSKPVTVLAEEGEFDVRLGVVPAHSRVTLRLPKSAVEPEQTISVVVHPEGGFDLASRELQLRRGEHLGLRVPLK